jgi:hypothetical protein
MSTIDEKGAWDILDRYVADCLQIDSDTMMALYATGSLAGGYYRPGQSDIDAVLIVENGLDNDPPFVHQEAFRLVRASLVSQPITEADTALLRHYVRELRDKMNAYLGIVV